MPRTKLFEMDGASFTIAPLTFNQVETWKNAKPAESNGDGSTTHPFESNLQNVVCPALNNALPRDTPEAERWTPKRCFEEMDQLLVVALFQDILRFSGFHISDAMEQRTQPQGETQAPSTSRSSDGV